MLVRSLHCDIGFELNFLIFIGTLSVNQFLNGIRQYFSDNVPGEPATWTFGSLRRQENGRFVDSELVRLLSEGCENVAGKLLHR